MQQCFPTISGERRRPQPYIPRHTYNQANRFPRSHRGRPSSIVSSKSFTRDIILLAPLETCVPRGASSAQLHDEGRVAIMVDFMRGWDEEKTRKRIEDAFQGVLDMNKPYPRYANTLI